MQHFKALCAAAALSLAPQLTAQEPAAEPIVIGETYQVTSTILNEARRISVRLPAEYADPEARKFPVVFVLDGGPAQDFPHIAGIAQSREMNYSFEPFILVGIESVNRRHELAPAVADPKPYEAAVRAVPGGSAKFRRYLAEELLPYIASRYRTDGHTALMGESLAGLFVIETLLKQPDLFDDYIAISPSLWWEEMEYGKTAADYFARFPTGTRRLYLTTANEGDWHREGTERFVTQLRHSAPVGLEWAFVDAGEQETHGTLYHPMALDAFRALYGTPSREYRNTPLIGGPPARERTAEEQALVDTECTRANSTAMTPGTAERAREALYFRCLLLDLGPTPREGTLGK